MLKTQNIKWFRENLYFMACLLFVVAMPLSKALLSMSLGVLVLAWLIAPGFKQRIQVLKVRKSIWVFILTFIVAVFGLLYSENLHRNLFLLFNIKICLVLLPIVIGTFQPFTKKQLNILLGLFTIANIIASAVSTLIFFQIIQHEFTDVRYISIFVESIRFALLLVLNICLLFYIIWKSQSKRIQLSAAIIILWFIYFLNILQALTGFVVLFFTMFVIVLGFWKSIGNLWKFASLLLAGILVSFIVYLFYSASSIYHRTYYVDTAKLENATINGRPYYHNLQDSSRVNGHLVNIYICNDELEREWRKLSNKSLNECDGRKWASLRQTLIYYMTSKGLRKDSLGFSRLSKRDIRYIEYGFNNAELAGLGLKARAYDVVREFDLYWKTGLPDGSITIRLNALVNGWKVFVKHPWVGTGYGDINDDIQKQFEADNKVFGEQMRQNPHNQFFTVLIGAGVLGFIVFVVALVGPGIMEKKYNSYLFLISFCIVMFSFLSDDTLERMIGCVITAFFFSLFLYAIPEELDHQS